MKIKRLLIVLIFFGFTSVTFAKKPEIESTLQNLIGDFSIIEETSLPECPTETSIKLPRKNALIINDKSNENNLILFFDIGQKPRRVDMGPFLYRDLLTNFDRFNNDQGIIIDRMTRSCSGIIFIKCEEWMPIAKMTFSSKDLIEISLKNNNFYHHFTNGKDGKCQYKRDI